jgi:hypothetical protein
MSPMSMMISELYDALVQAGAPEDKARLAASAVADYKDDIEAVKADLMLLKWMLGFNLVFSLGILWRVLI